MVCPFRLKMNEMTMMTTPSPTLPTHGQVTLIDVFTREKRGGNPVPLVADAQGMSDRDMQQVAAQYGHESAFVLPADNPLAQWKLRFFVPAHEMEMCGHATVGSMWALRQWGLWQSNSAVVETLSGLVHVQWDEALQCPWISQPPGQCTILDEAQTIDVLSVLSLSPASAATVVPHHAVNASTSRIKTLIEFKEPRAVHALQPDFARMKSLCEQIDSTGLYPYSLEKPVDVDSPLKVHARQFPRSSGYPEDAATGIAAAALWSHLQARGEFAHAGGKDAQCIVLQGEAMGSPSAIYVRARHNDQGKPDGCWLSGQVCWSTRT